MREKVHWLGRRDDVPGLLKSADVLVHASLWEGMPNAVLEAMAARRPVIGTAVEGTEDLVVPGQTGWLVPPRDAAALSRALIEAADSPERCRRYGEAGRLRVEQEFSLETTVGGLRTPLGWNPGIPAAEQAKQARQARNATGHNPSAARDRYDSAAMESLLVAHGSCFSQRQPVDRAGIVEKDPRDRRGAIFRIKRHQCLGTDCVVERAGETG